MCVCVCVCATEIEREKDLIEGVEEEDERLVLRGPLGHARLEQRLVQGSGFMVEG